MLIVSILVFIMGKMQYLCTCSFDLTVALLAKNSRRVAFYKAGAAKGGSTTFGNASLTLCFWLFETTTIELVVENIAG